ncbi:MAG: glucodextranase DOMON-like domain-containing protein, partial [Candidatus Promineifilaceae bacterium]|nr:glucodextranase DOMON-like domain-containing protein [Candidatus Promineifilaceae bacterium]
MFAEGWEAGGVDHFDTESEMFQFISRLAHMRTTNPLFTRGTLTTLADSETGPGVLAYRRDYQGETALVLFNTADRPILVSDLDTGLAQGTVLNLSAGIVGTSDLVVGRDGKMTLELPAREGLVLLAGDEVVEVDTDQEAAITINTDLSTEPFTTDISITGTVSEPNAPVKIITDGNLGNAIDTTAGEDGQYTVAVPISLFPPGQTRHNVVAYAPGLQVASAPQEFVTEVSSTEARITVYDLVGDDVGPLHTYELPTDFTFREQMDILSATASAYGTNLLVEVQMAEISTSWNPRNGFDHVLFHVFIDLPGVDGLVELPRINANAPEEFQWNLQSFSEGWGNRLYSTDDASAAAWGQAVTPAQIVNVDHATDSVQFLFLSDALGNPQTLEGAKVYITAWDWNGVDATYRPLRPIAGPWAFGGGDQEAGDPLIIDDTAVLQIPGQPTFVTLDAGGDDDGPYDPQTALGIYTKPTDPSFGQQMDIRQVIVKPDDDSIVVALEMGEVSNFLNAPNGFDHVNFHLFFDVTADAGTQLLPFLNAEAPEGVSWDFLSVVDGWNNAIYRANTAAADNYGSRLAAAPEIAIDAENNTIILSYPRSALGDIAGFEGTKIYVTTWDWDDEADSLRLLTPDGGPFAFGGGDGSIDPLILDEALLGAAAVYQSPIPPHRRLRFPSLYLCPPIRLREILCTSLVSSTIGIPVTRIINSPTMVMEHIPYSSTWTKAPFSNTASRAAPWSMPKSWMPMIASPTVCWKSQQAWQNTVMNSPSKDGGTINYLRWLGSN